MDANECTIAQAAERIEVLWHHESNVPGKIGAGGQSSQRYEREREMVLIQWLKQISIKTRELSGNHKIILAGPGETKIKLAKYLGTPERTRVIDSVDVGYTSEAGINEAIQKSKEALRNCKSAEDKRLGDEFARMLNQEPDLVDYGPNFDVNNVKMILVPEYDERYETLPTRIVEHPIVRALKICIFKRHKAY
jgi:peptide chain release factor subunit 1